MKLPILLCLFAIGLCKANIDNEPVDLNSEQQEELLRAARQMKYGSDSSDVSDISDTSLEAANKHNFAKLGSDSSSDSGSISDVSLQAANTNNFAKLGSGSDESLNEDENFLKTANEAQFAKYGSDEDSSVRLTSAANKKKLIDYVKECLTETDTNPHTLIHKLKQGKLDAAVTKCFYKKVGIENPLDNPEGRKLSDAYLNNELAKFGIEPRMVKECVLNNESVEAARKCVVKHYFRI